jgi:chromosome segregation ATPase
MSDIEHAEKNAKEARDTLEKLEAKALSLSGRLAKNADERREVAFAANTGDAKAKSRLEALHAQTLSLQTQREDLSAAIAEAQRRVDAAEKALDHARVRITAEASLAKLPSLRTALAEFDECVEKLCKLAVAIPDLLRQVDGSRSLELLRGSLRRAVQGPLFAKSTQLHAEVTRPYLRKSAAEAVAPVLDRIEREMRERLDGIDARAAA